MSKTTLICLLALAGSSVCAQPGWKWPDDPEKEKTAKEKQAYYRVQMDLGEYNGSLGTLMWLYQHTPDLNPGIYIDGAKVIDELLDGELSPERKLALQDSMLWMYDMRIKYFSEGPSVLDRKAYSAFKMYYKTPEKYPVLLKLYAEAYDRNGPNISDFNLTPYITVAVYYHKRKPTIMKQEDVLDIHSRISEIIDDKIAAGGDADKLGKEQDKVDAVLGSVDNGNLLSCEFVQTKLVPKFEANPSDLGQAKKVFSYSLKAKCSDKPYFARAGETLFRAEPSCKLAQALGDAFLRLGNSAKAMEYYTQAESLANSQDDEFEALIGQAAAQAKLGNKSRARSLALEAARLKPGASEPYNLIGNLYFTSFQDCKKGESKVLDRAVFIAAWEMYNKAGNAAQKEASKAQFPSIEEIFTENYEEGQKIEIGCWINETVTLQRR